MWGHGIKRLSASLGEKGLPYLRQGLALPGEVRRWGFRPGRYSSIGAKTFILTVTLIINSVPAHALDSARLQFTVPAPDPVQAGETLSLQALAINTGTTDWEPGTYYWVGEVYDLEYKLLGRTDQVSPPERVPAGTVASISLPFHVPATMFGRKLYRVFLVKDARTLITSEYKGFSVVEKPIPPAPEVFAYRVEGNLTLSYKNSSMGHWKNHKGATTFNSVGKIKDASYLINAYILHEPGKVFDPFIIMGNYYASWGTIYAGDVLPNLTALSVSGQGMRGAMLEQRKGRLDWNVLGGQTITSQAGTAATNGRYARSLYAAKSGVDLGANFRSNVNYFLSSDETGSLSSDPKSANFRGPTLVAQKNSGYGADLSWEPRPKLKFLAAYQKNEFFADTTKPGASDKAIRGEINWDRKLFKFKSYVQRAGVNFVAFGAPGVVGDRLTFDGSLVAFLAQWYTLSLAGNQYKDNVANNPKKVTTTQRVASMGHSFQFPSATSLSLNASVNTAKGQPTSALNNQTVTGGIGAGQIIKSHSISLNFQNSQFRDKNKLAHDLDTQTYGFSSNWRLPRRWSTTFGITRSDAKDKIDGSKRSSQSVTPSFSLPFNAQWVAQVWGTWTATKNTSPILPADSSLFSVNSEFTWARSRQTSITMGVGGNQSKDKIN